MQMATPYDALAGPLAVYVAAADGYSAGRVRKALEREGFQLAPEWGSLVELANRKRRGIDLLVIVEGERRLTTEDELADSRALVPDARCVIVCSPRRDRPQTLLWAGVEGIIVEPGSDTMIGPISRVVLEGYVALPETLRLASGLPPLSARERQLLALVVDGLTNREIAERLYLAESTVKRHLSSLFRRLGVKSRSEAAAAALAAERRPIVQNGAES